MKQDNVTLTQIRLFGSIRTKLIISFIFLFLVVSFIIVWVDITGVPFTPYAGRQGQQKEEVFRSLNLIADLKKDRLLRWIEERRNDIHIFASNDMVETIMTNLHAKIDEFTVEGRQDQLWTLIQEERSYQALTAYLNDIKATYGTYNKIKIVDAETGTILVSTNQADLGANVSREPFFSEGRQTGDGYVSDITLDPQSQQPALHFSHVVKNEKGDLIAILVMEINPEEIIKPILQTGEGLGEQGEALLVNQEGKILTSLKHPLADGSIATPLKYQNTSKPAVLATGGEDGILETEDYRGKPVLAAYRHIHVSSDVGWGMVVKRDREELLAPLQQGVAYTVLIGAVGMLVMVGLTFVLADNLTRPILSLSKTAKKVSAGDFEARAPVTTSDEVGLLATTFNSMIQHIQHWHEQLEEQVKTRTTELNDSNEALRMEIAERQRVEDALRESEHFNRTIVSSVGEGIVVYDCELRYMVWNKFMENLTGLSAGEVLGKNALDTFPHLREQGVARLLAQALAGKTVASPDTPYQIPQTEKKGWVRGVYSPHITADGKIMGVVATIRDITERKQAEESLQRRVEQLTALSQASEAVIASMGLNEVLAKILSLAGEVIDSDYTGVLLVDETGHMSHSVENLPNVPIIEYRIRDEGLTNWITLSRESVIIDEIGEDGAIKPHLGEGMPHFANPLLVEANIKSMAGLPLVVKDTLLGILYLHSLRPAAFCGQLPLLTNFANQVAVAIENARLYEAVQQELAERTWAEKSLAQRAAQLALLNDIGGQIATVLELDSVLERAAHLMYENFGYHHVALFTIDREQSDLIMKARAGDFANLFPLEHRIKLGEGINGWVANHGQKILANDVNTEPRYVNFFPDIIPTQSELSVPIRVSAEIVGVLDIQSAELNAFDQNDIMVIETLADQVAVAIENARLYETVQQELADRVRVEEALERLNRELLDKNRELEQVIYVASHDLRSPLVNIQGFSKELEQAFKYMRSILGNEDISAEVKDMLAPTLKEDIPEALQFILAGTTKMDSLLTGLLRLSRLGRAALLTEQLDMNRVISDVIRALEFQIKETKTTLQVDDLPPCFGDETQINQIFSNLIDNALKYLDSNRPGVIKISGYKEETNVVYCVEDNGIGIAAKHQSKIYEIFHRLNPTASDGEGLGLTIVHRILDRHGGKIWVESKPGNGSKFFVSLPDN